MMYLRLTLRLKKTQKGHLYIFKSDSGFCLFDAEIKINLFLEYEISVKFGSPDYDYTDNIHLPVCITEIQSISNYYSI